MLDIIQRQNLIILNSHDLCQGTITRNRKTVSGEELSVIDYILVCDFLADYLETMEINESRIHVLTIYCKVRKIQSDHNLLYARFAIAYYKVPLKVKRKIFNFKNTEEVL